LPQTNDQFEQINDVFTMLKRAYVDYNYINEFTAEIDFLSVFVDQNYESVDSETANKLRK